VLGYIFEKYINQKQMGAYYTKEDITEYISKNTIIPFLFDAAKKRRCPAAFRPHPLAPSRGEKGNQNLLPPSPRWGEGLGVRVLSGNSSKKTPIATFTKPSVKAWIGHYLPTLPPELVMCRNGAVGISLQQRSLLCLRKPGENMLLDVSAVWNCGNGYC
jgi:hypothetical protein